MDVSAAVNPFGDPVDRDFLDDIEKRTDFWNRKPQLQYIAHRAAREEVSPWGLLLAVQIHRLSAVPPNVVLVKRDGTPGTGLVSGTSLNMFGSLVADTGGGKSVVFRESQDVMPPASRPISDGTGQGLIKSIAETEKVTKGQDDKRLAQPFYRLRFYRHSLVLHAPEVKTLNAEFSREGSKTDSLMRQLWSGEVAGMTTGDPDRRVNLPPNMYRIAGLWGVQPVNATAILAGAEDGTPQRWIWAPAEEYRRGARTPSRIAPNGPVTFPLPVWNPGANVYGTSGGGLPTELADDDPLPAPIWVGWSPQMTQDIAYLKQQRDNLRDRDPYAIITPEMRDSEHRSTMESHLLLTRIKLAAVIGTLWGHASPDDEDWALSEVQMEVSKRELAGVWQRCAEARSQEILTRGVERGAEMHAASTQRNKMDDHDVYDLAEHLWKCLAESPMSNRALRNRLSNSRRKQMTPALDLLESQNRVHLDSNKLYWALMGGLPLPPHMAAQYRP
ncbi:MAG: hypothetical protein E6R04_03300 [Spirochaetes bacterium]|nr:MAG: hypothetical protein E6R04_03300 [Spirochaetota bacterium]